jgi:hypothetical protein
MLARRDLHHRLVNGSDYPLPAVNVVIQLDPLVANGLRSADRKAPLQEIYAVDPLLFDSVLKRSITAPGVADGGFPTGVFLEHEALRLTGP